MLAEPAPAAKPRPGPAPWETKGPGQALQTNQASGRSTPAEVLTAAPAPQPPLSELTSQPAAAPAPAPKPPADDIAHVQQARPAVELVEVEAGAEADFFKNAEARKTDDDDLFEMALPPLPNWEQDAHEIDADDIIEIEDAIKPRWGRRLAIGGGVVAGITAFILTISWLMGGFEQPITPAQANGQNSNKAQNDPSIVTPRKVSKTGSALLGDPTNPTPSKATRKAKKRSYRKRPNRRRRIAMARRQIKLVAPKPRSGSASLNKEIWDAYKKKMNGGDPTAAPSKPKPAARVVGGGKLPPSLGKRLYNEVVRNQGQVKYCYEQYLKQVYLSGRLTIRIRIEQSGRVSRVKILTRKFRGLKLSRCIARKMKRWRFSAFKGTPYIETTVPYLLRAQ